MCGIYCVYKQSRSCQLPFCASPIFHFEIGAFSVYLSPHFLLVEDFSIACSHCSLLWCENGIVYKQVIRMLVSYH